MCRLQPDVLPGGPRCPHLQHKLFTLSVQHSHLQATPSPQAPSHLQASSSPPGPNPHPHPHQAIFDAILVYIVNIVSPSGKWQQLQQQMCDPPHRKHMIPHGCSPECIRLQPGARTVAGATRSTARRTPTPWPSSTARTLTSTYSSCRRVLCMYCACTVMYSPRCTPTSEPISKQRCANRQSAQYICGTRCGSHLLLILRT